MCSPAPRTVLDTHASCREEVQRWRTEDIEQKVLGNAVVLWERYAEQNRRFVEERSEQLKSFANLAALITGFAIVAFLQACHTFKMFVYMHYLHTAEACIPCPAPRVTPVLYQAHNLG